MNRFIRSAAVLPLVIWALSAHAQGQKVEVTGQMPVRTDVQTLCPRVADALNDALAATVQEIATAATLDVRFELRGQRIGAVQIGNSGPLRYQRMLRRAVRGLECDGGQAAPQQVVLRVRFVDPFDAGGGKAVALLGTR